MKAKSRLDEALTKAIKSGILSPLEASAIFACVESVNTTITAKPNSDFIAVYGNITRDTIKSFLSVNHK
jgi:hypothetical protein